MSDHDQGRPTATMVGLWPWLVDGWLLVNGWIMVGLPMVDGEPLVKPIYCEIYMVNGLTMVDG